jgi:hypothetical protein
MLTITRLRTMPRVRTECMIAKRLHQLGCSAEQIERHVAELERTSAKPSASAMINPARVLADCIPPSRKEED